ncbi:MAG: sulfite exporter TauE/SafE family protein [Bacteriovoracaceae bacterium]|nr:sulfite exporter TauE/SafE family protein [Bacteriovoracaceae bacterium]
MALILVITGLFVGVLSSFFGVGGGILIVPTLYTLFSKIPAQSVIGTSLAVIFVNSFINVFNFIKAGKKPQLKVCLLLSASMVAGVLLSSRLAIGLSDKSIKLIFAATLVPIALRTLLLKAKAGQEEWGGIGTTKDILKTIFASAFGGIISGLTGLGGGAVLVPLFITVLHMPYGWVPVYSNVAMGVGTCIGMISYMFTKSPIEPFTEGWIASMQFGHVNFGIALCIFGGATLSSKLGVKWSQKVSPEVAKRLFASLLIIVSARIFLKTLL